MDFQHTRYPYVDWPGSCLGGHSAFCLIYSVGVFIVSASDMVNDSVSHVDALYISNCYWKCFASGETKRDNSEHVFLVLFSR